MELIIMNKTKKRIPIASWAKDKDYVFEFQKIDSVASEVNGKYLKRAVRIEASYRERRERFEIKVVYEFPAKFTYKQITGCGHDEAVNPNSTNGLLAPEIRIARGSDKLETIELVYAGGSDNIPYEIPVHGLPKRNKCNLTSAFGGAR